MEKRKEELFWLYGLVLCVCVTRFFFFFFEEFGCSGKIQIAIDISVIEGLFWGGPLFS
jgi:hypothetical protein